MKIKTWQIIKSEAELKEKDRLILEESVKLSKMEDKLADLKEKSAEKLARIMERLQKKDAEIVLVKMNNEKKLAEVLKQLERKQDEINDFSKEKL